MDRVLPTRAPFPISWTFFGGIMLALYKKPLFAAFLFILSLTLLPSASAQSGGSSTSVTGTVVDPTGAVVANATVEIRNPVSGFGRTAGTDSSGKFTIPNVPFNPYQVTVTGPGFNAYAQDIDVRSVVPVNLNITLQVKGSAETVTVEAAGDLLENDPTFHTDVDRDLFDKIPLESQSSSVSSLVTLASPGVAADSNGLFHGLGDHAENSFSVDGQPITDQQSKVFSNQVSSDSIQSLEVISGAPPAEFGGKTSLVIKVTTRSGQGVTQPAGSVTASYGSFGSVNGGFDLAFGGQKWGNFTSANGLNTGRFLDPPESQVFHAEGNEQNVFDRVDYQITQADAVHLNVGYTRSWFQTPNSVDTQVVHPVQLPGTVLTRDQRSQIKTFNIAPTWTRLISPTTLLTVGTFVKQDQYGYFPSDNVLADQPQTINQHRKLTNAGFRSDIYRVNGIHNLKAGFTFEHTFLTENFGFGITDPTFNPVCLNADGSPDMNPTPTHPAQCTDTLQPNPSFQQALLPNDLTRGGTNFLFHGHADIKQLALYIQDTITKGNWAFNVGIRGDLYRGITSDSQAEPRVGIAYNFKKTNTVFRTSYARVQETPFNENLVLASTANVSRVIGAVICPSIAAPIRPGMRNE